MVQKRMILLRNAVFIIFLLAFLLHLPVGAQEKLPSLYQRLGGYDAIAALVDDFLGRLRQDPMFAKFGMGYGHDSMKRRRQLTVDYFCQAAGGPCFYLGRTMKVTHAGLSITESEWQATMKHLEAALVKFKAAPKEKDEILKMIGGLRKDIVEQKK